MSQLRTYLTGKWWRGDKWYDTRWTWIAIAAFHFAAAAVFAILLIRELR